MRGAAWVLLFLSGASLAGEPLDPASAQALLKTNNILLDPDAKDAIAASSKAAAAADANAKKIAGSPQTTESLYELSSSIFDTLMEKTGGDPIKMLEIIGEAQSDPKSFYSQLSPDQKKQLHDIAAKFTGTPQIQTRLPASSD